MVVIDAITSNPGALMPWREMVRVAREEGAWSIVDAAHSLGQEVGALSLSRPSVGHWTASALIRLDGV